jgi:hypothetical protein
MAQRVQVREMDDSAQLRPVARPHDSYYQTALRQTVAPPMQESAMSLASSLAAVRPQLQEIIDKNHKLYIDEQQQAAQKRIAGLSFEEAKKLQESGQLAENDNPWYQAALRKSYGIKDGQDFRAHAFRAYNGTPSGGVEAFDPNKESFDSWYSRSMTARMGDKGDRMSTAGFLSVAQEARGVLEGQELKRSSANDRDAMNAGAIENLRKVLEAPDYTPDKMFRAIDEISKLTGRDKRDLTEVFLKWLPSYAATEGAYAKLEALANHKVNGVSLFSNPAHAAAFKTALDAARVEDSKRAHDTSSEMFQTLNDHVRNGRIGDVRSTIGAIRKRFGDHVLPGDKETSLMSQTQAHLDAISKQNAKAAQDHQFRVADLTRRNSEISSAADLIYQGHGARIQHSAEWSSADGKSQKSITPEELREEGMLIARKRVERESEGLPPAQRYMTLMNLYARNNMIDKATVGEITSGAGLVNDQTLEAIRTGKSFANADSFKIAAEKVDAFVQSGQTDLLWRHINDGQSKNFWQAYVVAKRFTSNTLDATAAAHHARSVIGTDADRVTFKQSSLDSAVSDLGGTNSAAHRQEVERTARLLVLTGKVSQDDALDEAVKMIKATTLEVDGRTWPGMKHHAYHPNTPELLGEYKKMIVAQMNAERKEAKQPPISASDYYIMPRPGQNFVLVPSPGSTAPFGQSFSYREMMDWIAKKDDAKSDAARAAHRKTMQDILSGQRLILPDKRTGIGDVLPNVP